MHTAQKPVILGLVLLLLAAPRPSAQVVSYGENCPIDTLGRFAASLSTNLDLPGTQIHQLPGIAAQGWIPFGDSYRWGSLKAGVEFYDLASGTFHVNFYPDAAVLVLTDPTGNETTPRLQLSDIEECTPRGLAYLTHKMVHEALHTVCPPHDIPQLPPGDPPSGPPPTPSCNNLNYAVQTAKAICDLIEKIGAGEPPLDENGDPIEGLETPQELEDYREGLCAEYQAAQERWNTETNAAAQYECACGASGYPPASHPDCPPPPIPPEGCTGDPATAYPDNKIIPDCGC